MAAENKINSVQGFQPRRDENELYDIRMRQVKIRMLQSKIDQARKASKAKEETKKQAILEEIRRERPHPLSSFLTSTPDLLSTPFDYESAVKEQLETLHSTHHIEQRMEEVSELQRQRMRRRHEESNEGQHSSIGDVKQNTSADNTQDVVRRWMIDRRERVARQEKRLARRQAEEQKKILEELEAKRQAEQLKMKIKVAQSEARIHAMHQDRVMRAEMHRYQTKVVSELIRHPRTFYFYQANGEALAKVRQKLQNHKLGSHKIRLEEQVNRLEAWNIPN